MCVQLNRYGRSGIPYKLSDLAPSPYVSSLPPVYRSSVRANGQYEALDGYPTVLKSRWGC